MCGIVGYVGQQSAAPVLLAGLAALEYRGYDSAGVYLDGVGAIKAVGKVAVLSGRVMATAGTPTATAGIAHTRWATHGVPSEANAHPHTDEHETVYVVHNGIIENWRELKEGLLAQGVRFQSETDTEVLAQLIGRYYRGVLTEAVREALRLVRGTYGLAVMATATPAELVVARLGSPIVIGVGSDAQMVASDSAALLPYTTEVVYLDDGELAVLTPTEYRVETLAGGSTDKPRELLTLPLTTVQKNGFDHFMEKEIFEAPEVIANTIRGRIRAADGIVKLGGVEGVLPQLASLSRLLIVGCGSAYYAGQVGRLMLEEYAGIPVETELGSEYRYRRQLPGGATGVVAVTQSGETADTLASVRLAKERGLLTLGVVNVVGSTIARETTAGVYNHAGPEIAVASTKAFLSQLTVFVLLTVLLARQRQTMTAAEARVILTELESLPTVLAGMLADTSAIAHLAEKYKNATDMMYIGRHFYAPLAYEGALKMKEVTYIHAEAYAAGELKHGSIALLTPQVPVIALAPHDAMFEKMMSNVAEAEARRAPVIVITTDEVAVVPGRDTIVVPAVHPLLQPLVLTVPLQLLAYYVGVAKGLDVDQPRNLAKSVTVE